MLFLAACSEPPGTPTDQDKPILAPAAVESAKTDTLKLHTAFSSRENAYFGFDAPKAINRIATIENEYFLDFSASESRYHGTIWATEIAPINYLGPDSHRVWDHYQAALEQRGIRRDSMDCTIYAMEAIRAGFGPDFPQFEAHHKHLWNNLEYAGWSVGYILTAQYDWKAYLILSERSSEYESCLRNFAQDQKYHVWKQPDIPIQEILDFDRDQEQIDSLLSHYEFGWGFSEQGWHTWITRFTELKECYWAGSPSAQYSEQGEKPLFLATPFTQYYDYASHIVVFPPQLEHGK